MRPLRPRFWSIALPVTIGVMGAAVTLAVTSPASERQLSLDDLAQLSEYPALNRSLSLWTVATLRHWQLPLDDLAHLSERPPLSPSTIEALRQWQVHSTDDLWRPVPKLLWSRVGVAEGQSTRGLWLITGVLAGICAGLFAACLWHRGVPRWAAPAALAPLVSPVAADVVLPFVGQADLLAAAGVLGAWLCWRSSRVVLAVAGSLCLAVALFTKESAFPAVIAVPVAIWLTGRNRRSRDRLALRALVLSIALLALRIGAQALLFGDVLQAGGAAGAHYAPGERHLGAWEMIGRSLLALPIPQIPQTDYSFLKQPGSGAGLLPVAGVVLAALGAVALAMLLRRDRATGVNAQRLRLRREAAAALVWIALFSSLSWHLVPIGALWAGRFAFLPLFGFVWLLVTIGRSRSLAVRGAAWAYLGIVSVVGIAGISERAHDWVSPNALWRAEVRRHPEHAFAWKNLAAYLQREDQPRLAFAAVARATALWPTYGEAWLARGEIARSHGMDRDAAESFARAEQLIPGSLELQMEIAKLDASHGNLASAEARLRPFVERSPHDETLRRLFEQIEQDLRTPSGERW